MRGSRDSDLSWLSLVARGAFLLLTLAATSPGALRAVEKPSFKEALENGKASVDLRYRWEEVGQDGLEKDSHASTLRTALAWRSQPYKGFSFHIEAENVTEVGGDLYDNAGFGSANNRVRDRPVVADPALTEINQAFVRYQADQWQLAAGRQEIQLGDERFVGNVGWRQNHQSFDALRIDRSLGGLRFTYVLTDKLHRITGQTLDLTAHLFNAGFDLQNAGKFTFYGYLLDFPQPGFGSNSTSTWGLEFAGRRRLGSQHSLLYEMEHAVQSDHADNTRSIDADYTLLVLGIGFPKATVELAWESLGEGGDAAFRTPLATLHGFNGWADKFLATPAAGLVDLRLRLGGKVGGVAWLVGYHDFESDLGSVSYGQELDLQLLYTCPKGVRLGLKGALYDADRFSTDTDKWMVWTAYAF